MAKNMDLESKLRNCAEELDQCAALVKIHELEPVKENVSKLGNAIADITEMLIQFESFRNQVSEPWKERCSFCKKDEDQVENIIAGPVALICNECVMVCQETLVKELGV